MSEGILTRKSEKSLPSDIPEQVISALPSGEDTSNKKYRLAIIFMDPEGEAISGLRFIIDTPSEKELLASSHSVQQMAEFIGVDSLAFISEDGLYRAMGETGRNAKNPQYCDACFTGDYPVSLTDQSLKKAS